MQVSFRYTDREFLHTRRVNGIPTPPRWQGLGLMFLCLLPSAVLIAFTSSFIAIISFAFFAAILIILISLSILKQPKLIDHHEHVVTLTPTSFQELNSHSEYEVRWEFFDEFSEDESEFLLGRMDRYTCLPKRAFTSEQCVQLRSFAEKANESIPGHTPPIALFSRIFARENPPRIYRFSYVPEDLIGAVSDPLKLVETNSVAAPKKKPINGWRMVFWLTILSAMLFLLLSTPGDPTSKWTPQQFLFLMGAIVFPFVFLIGLNRITRLRAIRRLPQVPPDENNLVLLKEGFAIGTPHCVKLYEWRDIDSFYENGSCFGFKSINELIQVIPKRIFGDDPESVAFLDQAINFHREHRRTFESPAIAIETGNPYQPPMS